ncbi:MAG TPA: ABC transporter ATP-binding protein [Acetobacteraceae bacterium]|nr:ABC transporter ATP-binding protein [Acetobacteraceae bacterium]
MSLLEVRGVTKAFGSLVAVDSVSLAVDGGELRAIIGPNGAGKTTFFNLITGFFPPTSGQILLDGRDITRANATRRVQMGLARTFQVTEIFPELTVRENVQVAVEAATGFRLRPWISRAEAARVRDRIDELIVATGLTAQAQRLVGELSHGDQRAAEIAMTLALRPRILLLDEPTAGMGEQETYQIAGLIRRLHKQSHYTVVLIEHDMRVVFNLADRIMVLDQGRPLAEGTPAEIAADPAVQAAYLGKAE